MSDRMPSTDHGKVPDLASVDRRLSLLSNEEREVQMPIGSDLSKAPTLTTDQDQHERDEPTAENTEVDIEHISGQSTPTSEASTSPDIGPDDLDGDSGRRIQFKKEIKTRWRSYPRKGYQTTTKFFYEEIDDHWTAVLIVVCFFISGVTDSVSYQTFSVFTSLQTGNTVLMALRLSNQPANRHPFAYVKSAFSVASYCLGGLFFNILHRVPTDLSNPRPPLHRWTLFTSFAVQSILLVISAALSQSGWTSTEPFRASTFSSPSTRNPTGKDNYLDLIPIAFLAFEAAGQVCLSRVLVVNELPTIVISTLYHDFIGEALSWRQLWKKRKSNWDFVEGQKKQIRRLASILALFAGAIAGGFIYATPGRIALALWLVACLKITVSLAFCLWRKKIVTKTVVTTEKGCAK